VREVLGPSQALWSRLLAQASAQCPGLAQEWHFAGPKYGWSLRLKQKDRIVLHVTPGNARFLVGVVLGGKALAGARTGGLSKAALAILEAAPRYAEGAGIRMSVSSAADLRVALQFLALKLSGATGPFDSPSPSP
jgi:hypothetical protein